MNTKVLKVLVVLTLVAVFAAFAMQRLGGGGGGAGADLPDRIAPDLSAKLNDIAGIEITSGAETLTLAKAGDDWTVASKGNYPAKFETVKQLLVGLAELAPTERKTADPARYGRLGLGAPGEGSDSLGVKLTGSDGSTVADFVLGEQVDTGAKPQRFVRLASDDQSWLAEGRLDAPTDPMRWLDTSVTQIPRDKITRVTITHPDGEVVSIAKEQGGANYTLETVPEGRTPKSAGEIGAPASALGYLRFDDVRAGDSLTDQAGEPTLAVYETTDGLRVTVSTWELDGKTWASIRAEPAQPAQPAHTQDAPAEGGDAATPTPAPDSDPQADAAKLNDKLRGWLFAIPDYQAKSFRKRAADLTDAPPEPEQPAPTEGGEQPAAPSLDAVDKPAGG